MNIAVVNTWVPFASGWVEPMAEALRVNLAERGHNALRVRIPFRWDSAEQVLNDLLACRLLTLPRIDKMIALRFPAYCMPHSNKVVWLMGQLQQPSGQDGAETTALQQVLMDADNLYLSQAQRVFADCQVTAKRVKDCNGMEAEVLHPPLARSSHFFCSGYGDYFFYPSRVTSFKRQALVVESMKYVKSAVRLVIAGEPEQSSSQEPIRRLIRENRLESKVEFIPSMVSEDEKARLFANALGCVYTPLKEDSYGRVTLEAYHSRKAVITCRDSGGVTTLVRDKETGLVVEPQAAAIAGAMDELFSNRDSAAKMGNAGFNLMTSLGIHWDNVIEKLLS